MKYGSTDAIITAAIANPRGGLSLKNRINMSISKEKQISDVRLVFNMSTFINRF